MQAALRMLSVCGGWQRAVVRLDALTAVHLKPLAPLLFPHHHGSSSSSGSSSGGSSGSSSSATGVSGVTGASLLAGLSAASAAAGRAGRAGSAAGGATLPAFAALTGPSGGGGEEGAGLDPELAAALQHLGVSAARLELGQASPSHARALKHFLLALPSPSATTTAAAAASASGPATPLLLSASPPPPVVAAAVAVATAAARGSGGGGGGLVLPGAVREAAALAGAGRRLVLDLALLPVRAALAPLPSLDLWCGRVAPAYSAQPSAHMTAVGEHLLGLYQELELFAASALRDDACLACGLLASGGGGGGGGGGGPLVSLSTPDWKRLAVLLPLSERETAALATLARGGKVGFTPLNPGGEETGGGGANNDDGEDDDDEEEEDGVSEEDKAVAAFCTAWLEAVVQCIVGVLLFAVLSVPRLDTCGAVQLGVDAAYLANVCAALGLQPHAALAHLEALAKLDRDAYADALRRPRRPCSPSPDRQQQRTRPRPTEWGEEEDGSAAAGAADASACASLVRKLERQLATVRGIAVAFGGDDEDDNDGS